MQHYGVLPRQGDDFLRLCALAQVEYTWLQGSCFWTKVQYKRIYEIMGHKILIVEDNELNMKLFHDLLEAYGYDTVQTQGHL